MKQVPATSKVEVDPVSGSLIRGSADTKTNPYDLYGIETALRIKEQNGAAMSLGRTSTFLDIYAQRDLKEGTFTEKEIQEERRLMYVAITRAKKNLIISHTEQTFVFGKLKKNKPSRFISEIDNRYIKNITC